MKKAFQLIILLFSFSSFAQIEGTWSGNIEIPNNNLPLVIHITNENNELKLTFDSPNQGAYDIPVPEVTFENNVLTFKFPAMMLSYKGTLENNVIKGTFTQGGQSFTLNLSKGEIKINRPQEPKGPFTYKTEDVKFENKKAGIKLAGTLTIPNGNGKYPAVVLVTGSGAQDRNEEILGHKPFWVIADYLTKNGYAVLRYDDRGFAQSEGDFTTATSYDFATDAEAAVNFISSQKNIDKSKIGILGHSEGGMIAQIVAANNKNIDFIISLAGPGIEIDKLMLIQKYSVEKGMGVSEEILNANQKTFGDIYKIIKKDISNDEAEAEIKELIKQAIKDNPDYYNNVSEKDMESLTDIAHSNWFREFIKYNPASNLEKIKIKVLALNGEKDVQVTYKENLDGWKKGLAHNKKATFKSYPNLNHLFQKTETGLPNEYGTIETTIEPYVLEDILNWLNKNVK